MMPAYITPFFQSVSSCIGCASCQSATFFITPAVSAADRCLNVASDTQPDMIVTAIKMNGIIIPTSF